MPAFLAFLLPVGSFIKKHWEVFAMLGLGLVLLGSVLAVYRQGHAAGQTQERLVVEKQHTETIKEVVADTKLAQQVTDTLSAKLDAKQDQQRADTTAQIAEIKDELAKAQASSPTAAPVLVPVSVRDASNSLVDHANGAADYTGPAD